MDNVIAEIKGTMISIVRFVFTAHDMTQEQIDKIIEEKIEGREAFFQESSFVIDVTEIGDIHLMNLASYIVKKLESLNINIIGYQCTDNQAGIMGHIGKGQRIVAKTPISKAKSNEKDEGDNEEEKEIVDAEPATGNMVIHKHIRSGQSIYAKNKNLIVYGNVSHGAEIAATGNITVIGSLKGKALAGVDGDKTAIVSAKVMSPEILAIAGVFITQEDLMQKFESFYGDSCTFVMNDEENVSFM